MNEDTGKENDVLYNVYYMPECTVRRVIL